MPCQSSTCGASSFVVAGVAEDCEGSVYLFEENQPDQLMRKSQVRQRKDGIGVGQELIVHSVRSSDQKFDLPATGGLQLVNQF